MYSEEALMFWLALLFKSLFAWGRGAVWFIFAGR